LLQNFIWWPSAAPYINKSIPYKFGTANPAKIKLKKVHLEAINYRFAKFKKGCFYPKAKKSAQIITTKLH
jgi:hypothetical protein